MYDDFVEELVNAVKTVVGGDFSVSVVDPEDGEESAYTLRIEKQTDQQGNIGCFIHLDDLYTLFCKGVSLRSIVDEVVRKVSSIDVIAMNDLLNWERVKDRIFFVLRNTERNKDALKDIPHRAFKDLSICYRIDCVGDDEEIRSAIINNKMLSAYGVSEEDIYKMALKNTPRMFPYELTNIFDAMRKIRPDLSGEIDRLYPASVPMTILSNNSGAYGAACILYPNMLETCASHVGGNFYLLPSSTDEWILVPENNAPSEQYMQTMVRNVNRDVVKSECILADHIYHYNAATKEMRCV